MKVFQLLVLVTILLNGTVAAAEILCMKAGQIVSLDVGVDSGGGPGTGVNIFIREGSLQNHVYYASVDLTAEPNSAFPALAASLLAAGHKVELTGGGEGCPTDGTIRYIGALRTLRAALVDPSAK